MHERACVLVCVCVRESIGKFVKYVRLQCEYFTVLKVKNVFFKKKVEWGLHSVFKKIRREWIEQKLNKKKEKEERKNKGKMNEQKKNDRTKELHSYALKDWIISRGRGLAEEQQETAFLQQMKSRLVLDPHMTFLRPMAEISEESKDFHGKKYFPPPTAILESNTTVMLLDQHYMSRDVHYGAIVLCTSRSKGAIYK